MGSIIHTVDFASVPLERIGIRAIACICVATIALSLADPHDAGAASPSTESNIVPAVRVAFTDLSPTAVPYEPFTTPEQVSEEQMTAELLERVVGLQEGWDGEGAPVPSTAAIEVSRKVIAYFADLGVLPSEVDPDVLGGVAIWFSSAKTDNTDGRYVWVSCMNDGSQTAVFGDRSGTVKARKLIWTDLLTIIKFLNGENIL